jgi:hypothetical protein
MGAFLQASSLGFHMEGFQPEFREVGSMTESQTLFDEVSGWHSGKSPWRSLS